MNYPAQRRQNLTRDLKRDGFDALLVSDPVHVRYLSGFTGDSSYLVLTPKHAILVSDTRFETEIAAECPDLEAVIRGHDKTTEEALGETLTKGAIKNVGVESRHATLSLLESLTAAAPKSTFASAGGRVEALRAIKDPSEVEKIKASVKVAERAFKMFVTRLRETDTEKDLSDELNYCIRRAGAERTSFPVIAAVGERGALPHAQPTARAVIEGSKLLIDWGAVVDGYHSDLTRTFRSPFAMNPTRRNKAERTGHDFEKVYDAVLRAQTTAMDAVREGVEARHVDGLARMVLNDAGYGEYFTHGLGHGIGLQTHEAPRVRSNSDDVLQAGMVITLEPGVYIPGWGGVRIEDDVLVLKDGYHRLSTLPRELGAIEGLL